ncbi:glycoside hydrolase family 3 protein [Tilletiaria anomala UBC 951]|uniref:Probable beta-glucosidase G n=1 Tax=Tilletiaria anomala (strain ATCC 24038 / CBS 436.72 / UBC 951) TaxID=1037660 RepID=A0A066VZK2_TILAU|nr:glycoside hydrolase family 3 protein [Tilletiaria anomala UBC 951]KDN44244.1 glycoside hydrolase family 3 protein [Tilletiaria anomala UBC 951]
MVVIAMRSATMDRSRLVWVRRSTGNCVGFTETVPRLNLTAICLQNSPLGVGPARRESQFPAGVTTAATWDREWMKERAISIGTEFKAKSVNMWLGPVTGGHLSRCSSDEYLNGVASHVVVRYAHSVGLMACAKHYAGMDYEQETYRNPYNLSEPYQVYPTIEQKHISSNVKLKTEHELYLWPFAEAVRPRTAAIMCSHVQACLDSYHQNTILKGKLGFRGAIVTDWGELTEAESAVGGLDDSMPGRLTSDGQFGFFFFDLDKLVANDTVPEARLDDMVLRTLIAWFHLQDPETYPAPSFDVRDLSKPTNNIRGDHHKLFNQLGKESVAFLKNINSGGRGLPSSADASSISVAGQDAGPNPDGWTSSRVSEAALVVINAFATEGQYRQNLTAWANGDELVNSVASGHNNTIVITHAPGPILVEKWADHKNVIVILHALLPGQESGNSIVPVLFGESPPLSDWPPHSISYDPVRHPQVDFTENPLIDYRCLSGFTVSESFAADVDSLVPSREAYEGYKTSYGTKTGSLYITFLAAENEPPYLFRGFEKVWLEPGASAMVTFPLRRKDFWHKPRGSLKLSVGTSSDEFVATSALTI